MTVTTTRKTAKKQRTMQYYPASGIIFITDGNKTDGYLEAIWKESPRNQATFLTFFGYLNPGCLLFVSGRRRRVICWMAAIFIHASLEEVSYS